VAVAAIASTWLATARDPQLRSTVVPVKTTVVDVPPELVSVVEMARRRQCPIDDNANRQEDHPLSANLSAR